MPVGKNSLRSRKQPEAISSRTRKLARKATDANHKKIEPIGNTET